MIIQLIKRKYLHFVFLFLLIIYISFSNAVYVNFILRNGKPVEVNSELPTETSNLEYDFGSVDPIRYGGQNFYLLTGYALHDTLPPNEHQIKIVLHSTTQDFIFDADKVAEPIIIKRRHDYNMNMRYAEFKMMFSKEVLPCDNYRIGIIIGNLEGYMQGFIMTNAYIERSPNTVRFIYEH